MLHPKSSFFLAIFSYFLLLWLILNFRFNNHQPNFTFQSTSDFININLNNIDSSQNNAPAKKTVKNVAKNLTKNLNNQPVNQNQQLMQTNDAEINNKERKILHQPLPKIPQDLRYELLNEKIIANFVIDENGKPIKITLTSPSKNLQLNALLLEKLQEWVFTTSNQISIQDVLVNFLVVD